MEISPRLKSEIRVAAHLRRVAGAGGYALVARKGDPDAGAIAVKVFMGRGPDGTGLARLFIESRDETGAFVWREPFEGPAPEAAIDARLAKERRVDPDLWIVEIEDARGRSFLD